MKAPASVRLDKWLWAVRLFRSRSSATAACQAGHVKWEGGRVKPSREVHVGETYTLVTGGLQRTIQVTELLQQRLGAAAVAAYVLDLTPPEEIERARQARLENSVVFPAGSGRPTKKQRRQLESLEF
jgi:ribosome-associated heat shock protein Hsp15